MGGQWGVSRGSVDRGSVFCRSPKPCVKLSLVFYFDLKGHSCCGMSRSFVWSNLFHVVQSAKEMKRYSEHFFSV